MGTKRVVAVGVLALLGVALGGCGESGGDAGSRAYEVDPPAPSNDRLFLGTDTGLTAMNADTGEVAFTADGAVPTPDWSTLFRAEPAGDATRLIAIDPATGQEVGARDLDPAGLVVRAVGADPKGGSVALAPPRTGDGTYPAGRAQTPIVVTGLAGDARRYDLPGNYEPEAFSTDLTSLFVIEYTPPEAPERYRVRRLQLSSGEVVDVYSVDKELQQAMRGTARTQVLSPDATRLYTLYTVESLGSAFVHVLSLDEQWAHCVDLPLPFGEAPEAATALAVAPDGDRLYVADRASGAVAEIDTHEIAVTRTADLARDRDDVVAAAAVSDDGTLYVGSGSEVTAIDTDGLEAAGSWELPGTLSTLELAGDGRRLYLGLGDGIATVDAATGRELHRVTAPGVSAISVVGGLVPPPAVSPPRDYQCAC
jgi:outer membrane protein assembly factor BamB